MVSLVIGVVNWVTAEPVIENPQLLMNPENVLRATLSCTTDVPTKALVVLSNDAHTVTVQSTQGLTTHHQIEIVGLHPQATYQVTMSVVDMAGNTTSDRSLELTTSALPADFPPIEITVNNPDKMQPGITFFSVRRWIPAQDPEWGLIVAIDEQGKVVWYHQEGAIVAAVSQLRNQNLLYINRAKGVIEMDILGNKKHIWLPEQLTPPIERDFHHDVIEMPSGNLLSLNREFRTIEGYTDENGDSIARRLRGDLVVEFTPAGEVVNQWSTFDLLDPYHIKHGLGLPTDPFVNWTHANSVFYDQRDDSIVVSLRSLDWVIKFARETGEVLWRLGEGGDFSLVGEGEWFFQQHAAKFLADGSLLLYDNGRYRTGIDNPNDFYSRAVQYQLDTSNSDSLTATQVWEFRDDEDFYSPFLCEVDHLANGNFLIADGGRVIDPSLEIQDESNQKWARIVEVAPPSEKVFELIIHDENPEMSYAVYRSEKFADLILANLGPTVRFSKPSQMPTGMDLTALLPTLSEQPTSLDLSVALFANKNSILQTINTLPLFKLPGWGLIQELTQGNLQFTLDNLRFAAHPWQIRHTLEQPMVQIDMNQTLRLVTDDGLEVLAHPAVQDLEAFEAALQTFNLPTPTIQDNGNLTISASETSWFQVRPDLISQAVNKSTTPGLFASQVPVFLIFETPDTRKWQQYLYPAPADLNALTQAAKSVTYNQGVLNFQWMGKNYQGMLDYTVSQGKKTGNFQVAPNESGGYLLTYPNGEMQKLLSF